MKTKTRWLVGMLVVVGAVFAVSTTVFIIPYLTERYRLNYSPSQSGRGNVTAPFLYPRAWFVSETKGGNQASWIYEIHLVSPDGLKDIARFYLKALYDNGWLRTGKSDEVQGYVGPSWGGFFNKTDSLMEITVVGPVLGGVWRRADKKEWYYHHDIRLRIYRGSKDEILGHTYCEMTEAIVGPRLKKDAVDGPMPEVSEGVSDPQQQYKLLIQELDEMEARVGLEVFEKRWKSESGTIRTVDSVKTASGTKEGVKGGTTKDSIGADATNHYILVAYVYYIGPWGWSAFLSTIAIFLWGLRLMATRTLKARKTLFVVASFVPVVLGSLGTYSQFDHVISVLSRPGLDIVEEAIQLLKSLKYAPCIGGSGTVLLLLFLRIASKRAGKQSATQDSRDSSCSYKQEPMGKTTIDQVFVDKDGNVILLLRQPHPWNKVEMLLEFQDRLNGYIEVVTQGTLYARYPEFRQRPIRIRLLCRHYPSEDIRRELHRLSHTLRGVGIGFEVIQTGL